MLEKIEPLIKVSNLSKNFSDTSVFSNLNFTLENNKIYGLIGPNGSGKSSLAKILAGLDNTYKGEVQKSSRLKIYYEPQRHKFPFNFAISVEEILWDKNDAIIKQFKLDDKLKFPFNNLSGGWQQRVLLCRATLTPCDLLILDEPFSMIDPDARHDLMHKLKDFKKAKTLLLISHEIDILTHCCNQIFCLHHHLHTHEPTVIADQLKDLGLRDFTGSTHKLFELLDKHHHDE